MSHVYFTTGTCVPNIPTVVVKEDNHSSSKHITIWSTVCQAGLWLQQSGELAHTTDHSIACVLDKLTEWCAYVLGCQQLAAKLDETTAWHENFPDHIVSKQRPCKSVMNLRKLMSVKNYEMFLMSYWKGFKVNSKSIPREWLGYSSFLERIGIRYWARCCWNSSG